MPDTTIEKLRTDMTRHHFTILALGDEFTAGENLALHQCFPYLAVQQLRTKGLHFQAFRAQSSSGLLRLLLLCLDSDRIVDPYPLWKSDHRGKLRNVNKDEFTPGSSDNTLRVAESAIGLF